MQADDLLNRIGNGRTDAILDVCKLDNWRALIERDAVTTWQWLVYYNDVTALRFLQDKNGSLGNMNLAEELGNAAFFGHWQMCRFLIDAGADVTVADAETGETALHSALSKAGRPYYIHVVKMLLEAGANVNAVTSAGKETAAFMRDVRTRGESPLHRAAAYADAATVALLIEHGADVTAKDINGDSPMSYASLHLRPAQILKLLEHGPHKIHQSSARVIISDHGCGWGNGMETNLLGEPH